MNTPDPSSSDTEAQNRRNLIAYLESAKQQNGIDQKAAKVAERPIEDVSERFNPFILKILAEFEKRKTS